MQPDDNPVQHQRREWLQGGVVRHHKFDQQSVSALRARGLIFRRDSERKHRLVKETLYILFRVESLIVLDREAVNKLSQHIDDVNRGLFFLISGIFLSFRKRKSE